MRAVLVTALLLAPCRVFAQDTVVPPAAAQDPTQQIDVIDMWHRLRNTPPAPPSDKPGLMIAAVPTVGQNPTSGVTFGAAAQLAFVAGDPRTTRFSSAIASVSYSTKQHTLVNARFDAYTSDNRWFIEGDNRFNWAGERIYGLGADTPADAGIDGNYTFVRVHETAYRRLRGDLYAGGGLLFDSHGSVGPASASDEAWQASSYVSYSQQHGLPIDSQQSGGVTMNARFDRRVGEIDPRSGWMAEGWYRASFRGFFGGDSNWQLAHLELRSYVPLGAQPSAGSAPGGGVPARHRLAFWTYADMTTTGAPPYFDLPSTVSDTYGRSSRGYAQGRYRGERLVYGEVEYRGMLTANGLLGVVGFANVVTLTNLSGGERLFDSYAPAAGGGLRVLFNKRSRTNVCIDVAFGKAGAKGVYFALQDAF